MEIATMIYSINTTGKIKNSLKFQVDQCFESLTWQNFLGYISFSNELSRA